MLIYNKSDLIKSSYKSKRPFNATNHELVDKKSKEATIEYFNKNYPKIRVEENEWIHGVDLIVFVANTKKVFSYIEVSTCKNLDSVRQRNTFKVPLRKRKFFLNPDKPTNLVCWNKDYTEFAFILGVDIVNSPIVTLTDNGYIDKFYQVDEKFIQYVKVNS